MATSKIEFAVQMTCQSCADAVRKALTGVPGIENVSINLQNEQVVVESSLPSSEIQKLIESTGRKVVIKGLGFSKGNKHLGAAVAMLSGQSSILGVVRFVQINEDQCVIDGTIDGLSPGEHGLHIHELGDLSQGCLSVGDHYNPLRKKHGAPTDAERHVGDLGNVVADEKGRAVFRLEDKAVKIYDIIGRSLMVKERKDDLGRGNNPESRIDGNSGKGLACGIIARSAGLFQNPKKICVCDGISIWDEQKKPGQSGDQPDNTNEHKL